MSTTTDAYVLSISAIPHNDCSPLIIHVRNDTVLDQTGPTHTGSCAWCQEVQSPTCLRHGECPLAPTAPTTRRVSHA